MASDLKGKLFLVTGGTEGIGKAACRDFARRGATLVLVGRNPAKTDAVAEELRGLGAERVETLIGDMSVVAEIRRVAAEFKAKHDRIDVLVNNAGAVFTDHRLSADGFEMTFALNHIGYWVFTVELLEVLERTPGARVVSTSSGAHYRGKLDLNAIAKRPDGSAGFGVYCDSKLANVVFTRELAKKLQGKDVAVSCFHPGFVATAFGHNNQGLFGWGTKVAQKLFARTPEKGAETLIFLATSPEAASANGGYYFDERVRKPNKRALDDELCTRFWTLSEELSQPAATT